MNQAFVTIFQRARFYPPPDVDLTVIRVDRYPEPLIPAEHLKLFFRLAKAGFSQKRKTLRNSISGGMGWEPKDTGKLLVETGLDPSRRAETSQYSRMVSINTDYQTSSWG